MNQNALLLKPDLSAIWVGYLNYTSSLRDILAHFEHCGPIWQAKIMRNSKSSHPFALIWFEKPQHARNALDMDRSILHGSIIKVRYKRMEPSEATPIQQLNITNILNPYTRQKFSVCEGSNLARYVSSLPPVHIANPEALRTSS